MNWFAMILTLVIGAIGLILGITLATAIDWFIKWAVKNNWESWQIVATIMTPGIIAWAIVSGLTKKAKP